MQPSFRQPEFRQPSSADAVRRVLTMAGVTGAALTLSAAAALPAFACHNGGGSDQSQGANQSRDARGQDAQTHDSQTQDSQDSQDSQDQHNQSQHNQGAKADQHAQSGDAGHTQGDKSQGDKSQGGQTDGHNPPGNNGTVKIHQVAGDSSPHDVPHVTCDFYVSFFGFDKNQTLNVSFTGQAPTGKDTPIAITGSGLSSKTSTTDAGGAGNDYDGDLGAYNGSNLDLSGLGAPAKQGYHIKLDVSTGEPGGHKYKVFWFTPCGTTGGTTQPGSTQPGSQSGSTAPAVEGTTANTVTGPATTTGTTPGTTTGAASVLGESITRGTTAATTPSGAAAAESPTSVLGESVKRSTPGLASLPFTGTESGVLAALGLTALGGGTALTLAGRRRRTAARA